MTLPLILFYLYATVLVLAALAVITLRNSVHAALNLVLAFFTSACIWLLLHAEFLGIALVLVYVGAVMVLFLFVVMMLDINNEPRAERFVQHLPAALLVAVVMLVELLSLLGVRRLDAGGGLVDAAADAGTSNAEWIGMALFSDYILPFEIAAVILTVAVIAAIALTLRRRDSVRSQKPAEQAAVRVSERLRLVDIARTEKSR